MNFIQKLRSKFFQNNLRKALQENRFMRRSMGIEEARSVGILFNAANPAERQIALRFASKMKAIGKKVQVLGFFNQKLKKEESYEFPHFTVKEVDFAHTPKGQEILDFMSRKFDLLFTLTQEKFLPLEYISALSKATFRVGPITENTDSYDLMVDTKKRGDLEHFIRQVEHFLNKLSPVYEPAAV
jgi:hypothetical protein